MLVKPVTTQGQATLDVYLPDEEEVRIFELSRTDNVEIFIWLQKRLEHQCWLDDEIASRTNTELPVLSLKLSARAELKTN